MFNLELIQSYIEDKITDYGASTIMNFVSSSPIGVALAAMSRFSDFVETGGVSELDELAAAQFRQIEYKFKFKGPALLKKMQDAFIYPTHQRLLIWQHNNWAMSRVDWLENAWRHDWRSQPRNQIGEWIPGRLPYPALTAHAVGKGKPRSSRRRRRIARYRRYGRLAARSVKWGSDGN